MDIIGLCAHFQHEPMQKHVLNIIKQCVWYSKRIRKHYMGIRKNKWRASIMFPFLLFK